MVAESTKLNVNSSNEDKVIGHLPGTAFGREANNKSSEVIDILLPVTFHFNPSTRLDNVKNLLTIRSYSMHSLIVMDSSSIVR